MKGLSGGVDGGDDKQPKPLLPNPPSVPQGTWAHGVAHVVGVYTQPRADLFNPRLQGLHRSLVNATRQREANSFYYKDQPMVPVDEFELECQQWRHGAVEPFECDIFSAAGTKETKASLAVKMQAENLVDPFDIILPVRIQHLKHDTLAVAKSLIAKLV